MASAVGQGAEHLFRGQELGEPKFAKIMGHFRGPNLPKIDGNPPFSVHRKQQEWPCCHFAKFERKSDGQFWVIMLWTFSTEKSRKFCKKFSKNSGRAPAWPISELTLSYGSRVARYQNCPPNPLGGGEIGGQNLKFDQKNRKFGKKIRQKLRECPSIIRFAT